MFNAKSLALLSLLFLSACFDSDEQPGDLEEEENESVLCSANNLEGICPGARLCDEGACIIDLDPGTPVGNDAAARWDEIWNYYDINYGAFLAKPALDWDRVQSDTHQILETASTEFQATDIMARAIEKIGDGHTALYPSEICNVDPGFGGGFSNTGACVIEGEEGLLVYKVDAASAFLPGDILLSIDEREPELLIADAEAQPRCGRAASSDAQLRQTMVASLMLRDESDTVAQVMRGEDVIDISLSADSFLTCDGRLDDDDRQILGNGVETKILDDDVLYIRLDIFGTRLNGEFVDQPLIDTLRPVFESARDHAGLVLDLRANPGGFVTVYTAMASWLFDSPQTLFYCQNKIGPAHDALTPPGGQPVTNDPTLHVAVPLAVLIDGRSFSASDFTAYFLQALGRAQTFGLATGGGFGGGGGESVAGLYAGNNPILCSDLQGEFLEGNAPPPDHVVQHSASSLREGVDNILEAGRVHAAGGN